MGVTVVIPLEPNEQLELEHRAAAIGKDVPAYVRELIKKDIASKQTFDEVFTPIREAMKDDSLSDEKLAEILELEKQAARVERRSRSST